MTEEQQQYRSYMLRLWRAGNDAAPEWRFSLEDIMTHERHGFANLQSLFAFLERLLSEVDHTDASASDAQEPGHD